MSFENRIRSKVGVAALILGFAMVAFASPAFAGAVNAVSEAVPSIKIVEQGERNNETDRIDRFTLNRRTFPAAALGTSTSSDNRSISGASCSSRMLDRVRAGTVISCDSIDWTSHP